MTPIQIKIKLLQLGQESGDPSRYTIAALAREFECRREELSMCVHQVRIYPELQEKLAKKLGYTREQVFGTQAKQAKVA